jgi:RIO-like serine/threonine protein kinase
MINEGHSEMLKKTFLQLKNAIFNFGLVHNDLSLKNTILGSDGRVYLLDWGSAHIDVIPHMDFAQVLHSSLDENSQEFALFLEVYWVNKRRT